MTPRPSRTDALVAGGFLAWAMVEIIVGISGPPAVNATCAVLACVPLAWRRETPIVAGFCCVGGLVLKTALGIELDGLAMLGALLLAAYSVGRHRPPRLAAWTVAAMIALGMLSLFGLPDDVRTASTFPFIGLWVGAPALAGAALRHQVRKAERAGERAARAEIEREAHARVAVQTERVRIARELHDTVAHAVSVMVLHAGAVRSRLPDGLDSERRSLEQAEDTGRQAIAELRRLLGVLRRDDEVDDIAPQPTLAQLDRLIEQSRGADLSVDVSVVGERRPLEPAVEVSAYRILQEALTNVRRHARAQSVSVRVGYDEQWLTLHVADDGVGMNGARREETSAAGAGLGLVGMRERVEVYGGSLTVSSPPAGGFALDVRLPVSTADRS